MKTLLRGMPTFQIQLSIQADLMTRGMGVGAPELAQFVLARVSVNCHALAWRAAKA